ncbi:Nuclear actin-protein involved in chromatin remodeling [Coelomomyces lativittatus]|nr:Nuclear actin-protein involved in chromatin remodeling [Coelomomyces lativittatus]
MSPDEIHQRRHQIRLNLERIRVPEFFFAPHMLGVDMRGIDELLVGTKTVFCASGGCCLPNLKTPLRTVLQPEVSTETPVQVHLAQDPILDTWKGMTKASSSGLLIGCQRNEYMETGTCFKAHPWSNYRK